MGSSKQRTDADNAFLRTQTQAASRERIMTETEIVAKARDEKTARLREARLAKESADREKPAEPKRK